MITLFFISFSVKYGMARSDWGTVSIPIGMLARLQKFLESDAAKNNGFVSRSDVLVFILREFLDSYEQSLKDSPPPRKQLIHKILT